MSALNLKLLPYTLTLASLLLPVYAKPLNEKILQQEGEDARSTHPPNHIDSVNNRPITTRFTLKRIGAAKHAVVQGIALDNKANYLYTANVTSKPSKGVINRYKLDNKVHKKALDAQQPSDYIGHQGISVEPQSSKLWASAGLAIKNRGWYATRFTYQASDQPSNIQTIKLFDKGYSKSTNSMPTFSPDGKYLIARSAIKKDGQTFNIIRVFDFTRINLKAGVDLSKHYLYEWPVNQSLTPKNFPFQGMATDGKYIYLISGYGNPNNKKLQVYTLQGKPVQDMQNLTLGKQESLSDGAGKHWEPEGLAVTAFPTKSLLAIFATGDKGKRNARVYSIPIDE